MVQTKLLASHVVLAYVLQHCHLGHQLKVGDWKFAIYVLLATSFCFQTLFYLKYVMLITIEIIKAVYAFMWTMDVKRSTLVVPQVQVRCRSRMKIRSVTLLSENGCILLTSKSPNINIVLPHLALTWNIKRNDAARIKFYTSKKQMQLSAV